MNSARGKKLDELMSTYEEQIREIRENREKWSAMSKQALDRLKTAKQNSVGSSETATLLKRNVESMMTAIMSVDFSDDKEARTSSNNHQHTLSELVKCIFFALLIPSKVS